MYVWLKYLKAVHQGMKTILAILKFTRLGSRIEILKSTFPCQEVELKFRFLDDSLNIYDGTPQISV
uniref:Uncharacterized protein n=1 Tax=Romanomermis culicivorax TaxID=13658 RepID=A0A915HHG0_ROMCU